MIDSFPGFAEEDVNGGNEINRESPNGATDADAELVDELNRFSRRGSQHYFPADGFGFDGM